jgi:hypothetical protein
MRTLQKLTQRLCLSALATLTRPILLKANASVRKFERASEFPSSK